MKKECSVAIWDLRDLYPFAKRFWRASTLKIVSDVVWKDRDAVYKRLGYTIDVIELNRSNNNFTLLYRFSVTADAIGGCRNRHTAPSIPGISFLLTHGLSFSSSKVVDFISDL